MIFNRFQQSDASTTIKFGGLGLGLSIVKHLVDMHGGTIVAESDGEGKGAAFTVDLPVPVFVSSDTPASSDADLRSSERLDGLSILVVDDEADTREILQITLQLNGAKVVSPSSVQEALQHFKRLKSDLVISDIGMPGENGFALIEALRSLSPDEGGCTPTLARTAFAREEDKRRAIQVGFTARASKPIDPLSLIATMARISRRH